jgi:hypothetical protein
VSKEITLRAWACERFDPVPADKTLQRWARDCWIFPLPRKVGKSWRVREDARFIGNDHGEIASGSQAA